VWSIGGTPREHSHGGEHEAGPPAAGAHAGKGPRGYCRGDVRLYDEVCDRLERDGDVDASDIEVTVKAGEVVLSGSVSDLEASRRAEEMAASCPGARGVRNHLRIAIPSGR